MRLIVSTLAISLILVVPVAAEEVETEPAFAARSVGEGVWVLQPVAAAPRACNSMVVERKDGLLIVGGQPTPEDARELLGAVARISPKPVRYLILPHPHAEAMGGASAFPETTIVVGRRQTLTALEDPAFDFGAEARARSGDPRAWVAPEIRTPVVLIYGRTDLDDPRNAVELLPTAHAHTDADIVVHVPSAGVLWAGALAFPDRNPYAADADVSGWVGSLNQLIKLRPAVVVPLRGDPFDGRELRSQRDSLAWLRGRVEAAFVDRTPVGQMPDVVLADGDLPRYFDPAASPSFVRTLIEHAVDEGIAARRKRGVM